MMIAEAQVHLYLWVNTLDNFHSPAAGNAFITSCSPLPPPPTSSNKSASDHCLLSKRISYSIHAHKRDQVGGRMEYVCPATSIEILNLRVRIRAPNKPFSLSSTSLFFMNPLNTLLRNTGAKMQKKKICPNKPFFSIFPLP